MQRARLQRDGWCEQSPLLLPTTMHWMSWLVFFTGDFVVVLTTEDTISSGSGDEHVNISFVYPSTQNATWLSSQGYVIIEEDIMLDTWNEFRSFGYSYEHEASEEREDRLPAASSSTGYANDSDKHLIFDEQYTPVFKNTKQILQERTRRAVTALPERLWPDAKIPFKIGPNISENIRQNILQAMSHWEKHTCIKFVNYTTEKDFIVFNPGPCGCCSFVGRRGTGEQEVTLSPYCAVYGVVIHELGHAVGFWHEHSRPDRDKYIRILEKNAIPEKLENFRKMSSADIESLGQPYDYYSVMHYRRKTFSQNGRNTMLPMKKGARIGQREGLSPGDIVQTRLLYNCPKPPCYEEFFKKHGNFTSPNFPIKYFKEHECTWVIHVIPGEIVTVKFTEFSVEQSPNCTFDYVEIREGIDESGGLVGRLCGEGAPGAVQSGRSLWILFHSDRSMTFKGFHARFWKTGQMYSGSEVGMLDDSSGSEESGEPDVYENFAPAPTLYTAKCNVYYHEMNGVVQSPVVPVGYDGDPIECSWTIGGGRNASSVMLKITQPKVSKEMRADCAGDIFQEMMEPLRHHKSIHRRSHKFQPKSILSKHEQDVFHEQHSYSKVRYDCSRTVVIILMSRSVMIQWSSDLNQPFTIHYTIDYNECLLGHVRCSHICKNTVEGYRCSCRRGYYLHKNGWKCQPKVMEFSDKCDTNMTKVRGKIRSTTEPVNKCIWTVTQPKGYRIILTFFKLHIPSLSPGKNGTCVGNYIELRAGKEWEEKGRFCGTRAPDPITIAAHHLTILLHTDLASALSMPYFSAKYIAYEANGKKKCFFRSRASGNITSPAFPKQYPPNTMCVWRVSARRGKIIHMTFDLLDIEDTKLCYFDYLEVRDGKFRASPFLGRYCGKDRPTDHLTTSGRHMWIMFISDESGSGMGFAANLSSEEQTWSSVNEVKKDTDTT